MVGSWYRFGLVHGTELGWFWFSKFASLWSLSVGSMSVSVQIVWVGPGWSAYPHPPQT